MEDNLFKTQKSTKAFKVLAASVVNEGNFGNPRSHGICKFADAVATFHAAGTGIAGSSGSFHYLLQ